MHKPRIDDLTFARLGFAHENSDNTLGNIEGEYIFFVFSGDSIVDFFGAKVFFLRKVHILSFKNF